MKKEIPTEMREQRARLKQEWIDEGCPGWFYEWLLDRIEKKRLQSV